MEDKDLTPLEKYVLDNREKLDYIEEPDVEGIWERIRNEERGARGEERISGVSRWQLAVGRQRADIKPSDHQTIRSSNNWHISIGRNWRWGIAASIALAVSLYFLLPQQAEVSTVNQLTDMFPEIAEQEADYQRLIAQKEGELNLEGLDKAAFNEIFMELQLLENIHKEYLQDLSQYEKNDRLVSTLLRYYERKIKILERLSREIEKKKNNDEKITQERQI